MSSLLEAAEIRRSFAMETRTLEVLRGVTLAIAAGESLAITGASGAGKSTLLHILGGLDRPTAGRVLYRGRDLYALGDRERSAIRARQIGFLTELLGQHDHVILMGDLNTPLHRRELQPLFDRTALVPPHAELPTYPSWRPARALDYILTSATVPVERRWVVPHPVSDHLPIAADIRMPRRIARAMGLDPRATTNGS